MGIWPFRRKSSRRKMPSGANMPSSETAMHRPGSQRDAGRYNLEDIGPSGLNRPRSGKAERRQSRQLKKLQRNPEMRAYSFSPGRNDSIRVPRDIHKQHPVPPLPKSYANTNTNTGETSGKVSGQQEMGELQEWQRVPTLHKRSGQDLPRRKSSKKRKEDHDREAEIKAMSAYMPNRAATTPDVAGRPLRKDTKKMRGINRIFTNPASDVSLPMQESIHSSLSSHSDRHASYKLRGMDLFSPHPTIRYAENPRYAPGAAGVGSDESESRKRRIIDRAAISQETIQANTRIDELADDLDAGDIRELMERDQRRRDRKQLSDQQKVARNLAKRAEIQRAAEIEAVQKGTAPPKNMERGVFGREVTGLGIVTADPSSPKRKTSNASSRRWGKRPTDAGRQDSTGSTPIFHRSDSLPATDAGSPTDELEPVIGTAQVARLSRASMSPPASPKGHTRGASNISEMMDLSNFTEQSSVKPEPTRSSSETSTRQHQSWTSFFKRGTRQKRGSIPSSFSNTSRDSMAVTQPPPVAYVSRNVASGMPKRTMSKFREDLPELPISPPASRVQSPEADIVPPIRTGFPAKNATQASIENTIVEPSSGRHDTPTSGHPSLEPASRFRNETPTRASPEPMMTMSQSLASIDSEGSWLSGRPRAGSKRSSAPVPPHLLRDSASSLQNRPQDFSESAEELGIAEDEYFSRLTPGPEEDLEKDRLKRASGNPVPSSDDEDVDSIASPAQSHKMMWGASAVARQPSVVHHSMRAKSREGLLNDYNSDFEEDAPGETPQDLATKSAFIEDDEEAAGIQRATSVNMGKAPVRRISVGSVKLLDVKRASAESKRLSIG